MSLACQMGEEWAASLTDLPDDVLFVILSFCDLQALGRLSAVCRRLAQLARQDCVWVGVRKTLTVIEDIRLNNANVSTGQRGHNRSSVKEQCRIAFNWARGIGWDVRLIHHRVKQMPWIQFDNSNLWVSYKNIVKCYNQKRNGYLQEVAWKTLRGHGDDVGRFISRDDVIVSGSRDASICCYSAVTGQKFLQLHHCHTSDIQAVDFHRNVIVSGSRDTTVKLWSMSAPENETLLHILPAQDRVWSLAMNPAGGSFCTGTAGINHVPPLRLWDTERVQLLGVLGSHYKYGAGVLDIQYESPDIVFSCGYDTYVRMWDLRASYNHCVLKWEEPFDSTIYCVKSDRSNTVITGTARHGLVRIWDKRKTTPVQLYYAGKASSPVYSLAFDSSHLYVALDRGINMLDFTIRG